MTVWSSYFCEEVYEAFLSVSCVGIGLRIKHRRLQRATGFNPGAECRSKSADTNGSGSAGYGIEPPGATGGNHRADKCIDTNHQFGCERAGLRDGPARAA